MSSTNRVTWRGFTSVLAFLSFLVLLISGVILFFVPPGRVANWNDLAIAGLSKSQWQLLHTSFSLLFLIAAVLHLIFNWRPMVNYFRTRPPRRFSFGWQWVAPVILCAALLWGAMYEVWPLSKISEWRQEIKRSYDDDREFVRRGRRDQQSNPEPTVSYEAATQPENDGRGLQRRIRGGRAQ